MTSQARQVQAEMQEWKRGEVKAVREESREEYAEGQTVTSTRSWAPGSGKYFFT